MDPMTGHQKVRIFALATQGAGGNDEARLRALLEKLSAEFFPYEYAHKIKSAWGVFQWIFRERPDLVVLEGTGSAGGLAVIFACFFRRIPYVLSSGDAVGPFVAAQHPWLGPFFRFYEKVLTRRADGFIGWTPYLTGRALTFGAPRAMTAAGWAPSALPEEQRELARLEIRQQLGIPQNAIVVGLVGSLAWNARVGFCYGSELVRAFGRMSSQENPITVLIVGEGSGRPHLEALAGGSLGKRILLTGSVPRESVPRYLAAMDLASLPQSVDEVGSFRYSTKLSEYMAAGLPMVMGQNPMAYDLPGGWFYRLPGDAPWSEAYLAALASLLDDLTAEELQKRRMQVPRTFPFFEKTMQVDRVSEFILDIISRRSDGVWKATSS